MMNFRISILFLTITCLVNSLNGKAQLVKMQNSPLLNEDISIISRAEFPRGVIFSNILNNDMWFSDGTSEGSLKIAQNICDRSTQIIEYITEASGKVYFNCAYGVFGTDGTIVGTQKLINSHTAKHHYISADSTCYFLAEDNNGHPSIIRSNGTTIGTSQMLVPTKNDQPVYYNPLDLLAFKDRFYLILQYGQTSSKPAVIKLLRFDSKQGSAEEVLDLGYHTPNNINTGVLKTGSVILNDQLFISDYNNALSTFKIWMTKGDTNDLQLVKELTGVNELPQLHLLGDHFIFQIKKADGLSQVWGSDGTEAGTQPIKDGGSSGFIIFNNGSTGYLASLGLSPNELTVTDGSLANTNMLLSTKGSVDIFSKIDGITFFRLTDSQGKSLWRSDGKEAGTYLLKNNFNGNFMTCANKFFFTYNDGITGNELWSSDGSFAGTNIVNDFNPGAGSSDPTLLFVAKNQLNFFVNIPVEESPDTRVSAVAKQLWAINPLITGKEHAVERLINSIPKIYPNPSSRELNIRSTEKITAGKMINIFGEIVLEYAPNEIGLDVSELPCGLYFFVYETAGCTNGIEKVEVSR